jgi:hypothetical protein
VFKESSREFWCITSLQTVLMDYWLCWGFVSVGKWIAEHCHSSFSLFSVFLSLSSFSISLGETVITMKVVNSTLSSFLLWFYWRVYELPLPTPYWRMNNTAHIITFIYLIFYKYISSNLCQVFILALSYITEELYSIRYLVSTSMFEHFEFIAPYQKVCKLVNHIEKWILYNVLYGNCIRLFWYLTHFMKIFCNNSTVYV